MPARGRCSAPRPLKSTCWSSRGLWTPTKLPYNRAFSTGRGDMTAAIEIYTRPGCGYCTAAKSLLSRKNAPFTELSVSANPAYRDEMYSRACGGVPFPQIFIGKTHVGGCDELYALDREGKLDGMLAAEGTS